MYRTYVSYPTGRQGGLLFDFTGATPNKLTFGIAIYAIRISFITPLIAFNSTPYFGFLPSNAGYFTLIGDELINTVKLDPDLPDVTVTVRRATAISALPAIGGVNKNITSSNYSRVSYDYYFPYDAPYVFKAADVEFIVGSNSDGIADTAKVWVDWKII